MGKDIVEDVFCILVVVEGNVVLIAEQLVRILREGDDEVKLVVFGVLWVFSGYRYFVFVIRDFGVIFLLVEILRDGFVEFRERVFGVIFQLSYNEDDREVFFDFGMILILIEWLGDELEEFRDNVVEVFVNFFED